MPHDLERWTYSMGRISQHLQGLDSIRFEWTVEDQESRKIEITLDLVSSSVVDLESAPRLYQTLGLGRTLF